MSGLPRARSPELMDQPEVDGEELARSLSDLEGVNRWLGGRWVALRAITPILLRLKGRPIRVLDVGTGAADVPLALAKWGREAGVELRVVASDLHAQTVEIARRRTAHDPHVVVHRADALALPYAAGAFDIAMCHTALHHFDPPDAVRLLREMGRVAQHGVVVTDLIRSWLGMVGVKLLAATVWRGHPVTRHDGPTSIRAAYTAAELLDLAREAGLRGVQVRSYLLFDRMALVVDRTRDGGEAR